LSVRKLPFQIGTINLARAVYALNWFNIAPGLADIASSLNLKIVDLGVVTTGFYIGLAPFQIAGGVIASKIGNRITSFMGLLILGSFVIVSGLSNSLIELFIARLFEGIGSSLFFSPALGMLSEIVPDNTRSFHIGLFNGSFNIGGGIGILGWTYLDSVYSWRFPLELAGMIMIAVAVLNFIMVSGIPQSHKSQVPLSKRVNIAIRTKILWILPLAALVGILAETITGQLFVYYAEVHLDMASSLASILGTAFLLFGFAGGTIGGYLYGRSSRKNSIFVGSMVLTGLMVILIPFFSDFIILLAVMAVLGIMTVAVLSILYVKVVEVTTDKSMVSFNLSFINFVQNVFGSLSPFFFTVLVFYYGYGFSWFTIGFSGIVLILLLLFVRKSY
jgi:ACDE family multidrug resistance protein